jgi:signal transduction histidine kinase
MFYTRTRVPVKPEARLPIHPAMNDVEIGKLARAVAHDFNNVLTAISGYTELLAASFDAADPRVGDVDQIRKAADHAASLTRQLLAATAPDRPAAA